jgi:hypothetical protein
MQPQFTKHNLAGRVMVKRKNHSKTRYSNEQLVNYSWAEQEGLNEG